MLAGLPRYSHVIQAEIGDVIKQSCGCNQVATRRVWTLWEMARRRAAGSEKRSGCPAACGGGECGSLAAGSMSAAKDRLRGYNGGMVLRRTPRAVYDTLYHLVWSPKYRRDVLQGEIQQRVRELFADIAGQYDITIDLLYLLLKILSCIL